MDLKRWIQKIEVSRNGFGRRILTDGNISKSKIMLGKYNFHSERIRNCHKCRRSQISNEKHEPGGPELVAVMSINGDGS